ncbi:hypothetical protein GCM10010348_70510 [Streptomyces anthocyanicus]|uniref:hypothetical protein n=1 Tax=Streptomyces TaxID=1883 RepID=UPI0012925D15|nr:MULTISPECIES: hypothetical protein [Streptomyces]MBQ0953017.1 hypothetical protein [Streptomyces sp. RK76]QFX86788.1 hypothetical protein GEV49_38705 [Streptomyces sp. SYP-A7193]GHC33503.1 hypothetical protein GCM10010348_70510 [Streptomyces anthocyanicus]
MSEDPQVKAIQEQIENRERELVHQTEQLRACIKELTRQLDEIDTESESMRITRKTPLTLPTPSPASEPERPDIPDHPAYRQILTALADEGRPMPTRDHCQTHDLTILPKNTEGSHPELKRLSSRGILTEPEPEPGLLVHADA